MNRGRHRTRTLSAGRRAGLLLEALLALALLATSSALLTGVVRDSSARLARAGDEATAADLARSAIARVEGGLATPETLSGPAPAWDPAALLAPGAEGAAVSSDDIAIEGSAPTETEWVLSIETQPTPYDGLTLVSVTATREAAGGRGYTIHQLVRLEPPPEDEIGDDDELAVLIEREQAEAERAREEQP